MSPAKGLRPVPLSRTSRLERGKPLTARTPLTRGAPLARRASLPAGADEAIRALREYAMTGKSAATRRDGGNSGPTPGVRLLVLERDGYRCACGCRQSIIGRRYSLGHRKRASQSGKAVPSNLLTFLGWGGEECHGRIDSRRDPRDEANGLTVRSWQDPVQVPVLLTLPDGSKVSRYLWDDGTCRDEPQSAVAA